jgi:hypothetical protein
MLKQRPPKQTPLFPWSKSVLENSYNYWVRQEIPRLLRNQKVQCLVYSSLPLDFILSNIDVQGVYNETPWVYRILTK